MNMINCFAYSKEKVCRVLAVAECIGENCPFFKTKRQFEEAARRADNYYKGKRLCKDLKKGGDVHDR